MGKKGTKRTIYYFYKPKVDVLQDRESPPDGDNQKEAVHKTQPSDQQYVHDNHVNESPRVEPEKDVHFKYTKKRFNKLKKVNCGYDCAFITHIAEIGELETGKGQNQIQNVQRPGDTRWSSHFRSICSLMSLYGPAYVVLSYIAVTGSTTSQKELLRLSVAPDPRKSFKIDDICTLVKKFYPLYFTDQEKIQQKAELQHYELDVRNHPRCKSRVHMFLINDETEWHF
ncbi:hypothetical protein CTI12_AA272640 [Artemisia annua]|uniref:Uncharacterized protein n=1 Tax=Artemisia annua TaxID=35608 RepID=A0A2U1LYK4_ARTAN|nr:hypothetical protein CTI12_AA272640 [Artemisia annua]